MTCMSTERALGRLCAAAAVAGSTVLWLRYRRDLRAAAERLEEVPRRVVDTPYGPQEYAVRGPDAGHEDDAAVLVSHGILHGRDGGMLAVRDLLGGRRVVVPSRFGYLGSALPATATAADQADAFVAVMDDLALGQVDVLGISAGTGAALQAALRHPDRVRRLVLSSGSLPGSPTTQAPPPWAAVFYTDPAMWLLKTLARPAFARLMGVPSGFPRGPEDAETIATMLDSIFPVGLRAAGALHDAYVTNPEVEGYPLEEVTVPTLVVHAVDDPLASYEAAAAAVERMPDATLVTLDSGGHLQLGQSGRVRAELAAFL